MKGYSFAMSGLGLSSRLTSTFFIGSLDMKEANAPSGFTPECATVLGLNLSGLYLYLCESVSKEKFVLPLN